MTDKAPELKPCPIALAITEHWGERCPDYEQGCPCCDAWAEYDRLTAPMTRAQAARVLFAHWFLEDRDSKQLAKDLERWWKRGATHDKAVYHVLRAIAEGESNNA